MKSIYLIGTNHRDPKGPNRLYRALNTIGPDFIVVESSEEFTKKVLLTHHTWSSLTRDALKKEHAQRSGIKVEDVTDLGLETFMKTLGYEIFVSFTYCVENGIRMYCKNPTPEQERENIKKVEEVAGKNILSKELESKDRYVELLTATPDFLEEHQKHVEESYKKMVYPQSDIEFFDMIYDPGENAMAQEIETLNGVIAVPVGSAHIFSNRRLFNKVKHLNPKRFVLSDFDKLITDEAGLPLVFYEDEVRSA